MVFAGFSAESLAQRITDCKPKVVITCNAVKRGSKVIYLKDIVDAALAESARNGILLGQKLSSCNVICFAISASVILLETSFPLLDFVNEVTQLCGL